MKSAVAFRDRGRIRQEIDRVGINRYAMKMLSDSDRDFEGRM